MRKSLLPGGWCSPLILWLILRLQTDSVNNNQAAFSAKKQHFLLFLVEIILGGTGLQPDEVRIVTLLRTLGWRGLLV